ncbi:hypothetical protein YC2023_038055 [Brassica napus]
MKVVAFCFASKNDSKHPHFCGICLSHLRQNGSSHIESVNTMINKTNDKAVTMHKRIRYATKWPTNVSWLVRIVHKPVIQGKNKADMESIIMNLKRKEKKSQSRRLGKYLKEQKGRIYIIRRCVMMLLCSRD